MRIWVLVAKTSSLVSVFTTACVATGTSEGVSTTPCGVSNTPSRARLLLDFLRIRKRITIGVERIELSLRTPEARVLPLYYTPIKFLRTKPAYLPRRVRIVNSFGAATILQPVTLFLLTPLKEVDILFLLLNNVEWRKCGFQNTWMVERPWCPA